jgi:Nuclear transport factor 2 (NTF2) domain
MLTFESAAVQGVTSIIEKLTVSNSITHRASTFDERIAKLIAGSDQSLPFQKVQHRVDTTDAQPSSPQGGILVMVTGALMVCQALRASCVGKRKLTTLDMDRSTKNRNR